MKARGSVMPRHRTAAQLRLSPVSMRLSVSKTTVHIYLDDNTINDLNF